MCGESAAKTAFSLGSLASAPWHSINPARRYRPCRAHLLRATTSIGRRPRRSPRVIAPLLALSAPSRKAAGFKACSHLRREHSAGLARTPLAARRSPCCQGSGVHNYYRLRARTRASSTDAPRTKTLTSSLITRIDGISSNLSSAQRSLGM